MIVLQPRLAGLLFLVAPLWLVPGSVGTTLGAIALGVVFMAVVIDILLLPSPSSISLERELSSGVGIGDIENGVYRLHNHTRRRVNLELRDRMPPIVDGGINKCMVTIGADKTSALPFTVRGRARGSATLPAAALRVRTVIGLVALVSLRELGDEIKVVPSIAGVRRFRLLALQHKLSALGVRELRRRGEGSSFASLREYVRGDDPRHIDWKATSRRGKFITREFTIERSQTVMTLIDAGRGMMQRAGDISRLDHALSAALVLTDVAVNAGDRVGTIVFNDDIRAYVPPLQSRGALQVVRDAFTPVVASNAEPDYATAFRFLAARQRKRALMVFFTDVLDTRASRSLMAHVARSSARHLVLVVALRNDALFSSAQPRLDGNSATAFNSAAAEELILAREEVLERMRHAGVIVLDVSPQAMAAAVVNRYLELKSRGAL